MDGAQRVVVVGQIARDLVLRVAHPPGPGMSEAVTERLEMLGGKGANQAVALAQLGMSAALVGAVGDDEVAGRLMAQAAEDGIDVTPVAIREKTPSGLIVSIVDAGGWRYLEDLPISVQVGVDDVRRAQAAISAAGTVVIQLQQPAPAAIAAAELGRRSGARVVLDGAPADRESRSRLLGLADVVRADAHEAEFLTDRPIRHGSDAVAAGRYLLGLGPSLVALAAGPDGNAVVWSEGAELLPLTGHPVVDTTGAGDAFVATLVASLALAAAHTVTHLGGRPRLGALVRQRLGSRETIP